MSLENVVETTGWTCSCDACNKVHDTKEDAEYCAMLHYPDGGVFVEPVLETAYECGKCCKRYWTWGKARFCCDEEYWREANRLILGLRDVHKEIRYESK